jgi:NADPH:quinone reductase-like Zn-dependent oxidoreductase
VTNPAPIAAIEKGDDAPVNLSDALGGLGQGLDGVLRSKGVFHEKALSHAPKSIGWLAAGTLTCTWVTAWNVLFGVKGQEISKKSWILIEGTGGVSIAVLQIAVAVGATVVATTSSEEKATRLKALGASHVANYRTFTEWGVEARKLTPDGRGFDLCVDIGGNETLPQALAAVRTDGFLYVLGAVGAQADPVPLSAVTLHTCTARGILGGSRSHLAAVVKFIDEKGIQPAVDDVVFELVDAKQAYRRLEERKHFSKVIIRIDHLGQE